MWKLIVPLVAGFGLLGGAAPGAADAAWLRRSWDGCGTPVPVEVSGKLDLQVIPIPAGDHLPDKNIGPLPKVQLVWTVTVGGKVTYYLDFAGKVGLQETAMKLVDKNVLVTGMRQPGSTKIRVTGLRAEPPLPFVNFDVRCLVGMGLAQAREVVQARGLKLRIVGMDGVPFPVTMDLRPDRVNVWVEEGRVTWASVG
jgi:hypothetical protein